MTVDRSDLECPDCRSPLAPLSRLASQYDDHRHELIYASRCPNGGCATEQVSPATIRSQLEAATNDSAGPLAKLSRLTTTLRPSLSFNPTLDFEIDRSAVMLAAIIGLLLIGVLLAVTGLLPASLGNDSSGTAAAYANLTKVSDPTLNTYNETGNWTIYEYNGQFVATGKLNGSIVYLRPSGNVTQTPYFYDLRPDVRKAILAWSSKHGENPARYPNPDAPAASELTPTWTTNWSIFKHNGSYVVSGKINGTVVYLYPNGTYHKDPFFYENKTNAKGAIIIWELHRDQFPEILPSAEPVTTDEVRSDLEEWDSDRSSETPGDPPDLDWDDRDDPVNKSDPSDQQESHVVRGEVTDSNGESVEGATVHLHSNPRTTTTGPNGSYTFHNVTPGNHTLYVDPPENTSLAATKPVNLTMTESGDLRVHGSPDHVTFFATTEGTVSENSLHLRTPPEQPISARGNGSAMQTALHFEQPLNAENTTLTLTSVYTATEQATTITGRNTSETISIDGNTDTGPSQLLLKGQSATRNITTSGTYTGTDPELPIKGNLVPRHAQIILSSSLSKENLSNHGVANPDTRPLRTTFNDPAIDGDGTHDYDDVTTTEPVRRNGTYDIAVSWSMYNSYYDTETTGTVVLKACDSTDCRTVEKVERDVGEYYGRGKASGTIETTLQLTEGEYIKADVDTFDGKVEVERQIVTTYRGSRDPATNTLTVDGNLKPTDATIRLTGKNAVKTKYGIPRAHVAGNPRSGDTIRTNKTLFVAPESGYYEVELPWQVEAWTVGVWGTEVGGDAALSLNIAGDEVLSKSVYTTAGEEETKSGTYTNRVYLEKGETIVVRMNARDGADADIFSNADGVVTRAATGRVTLSVNGQTLKTKFLSRGESTTRSLPLEPGTNTITVQTSGGKAVGYQIEAVERTGTKSPSVAVGDTSVCSFSGVFEGSETCSIPKSLLEPDSRATLNLTTDSGPVNWTFDYDARATPQNTMVTVNGTTYHYPEDFNGSGPLATVFKPTASRNISTLGLGTNDVHVATDPVDGLQPEVVSKLLYATEAERTAKPTVVVKSADGSKYTKTVPDSALTARGKLTASYTMSLPADWFAAGENVILVQTPDQSLVRARLRSSGLYSQYHSFNRTQIPTTS